MPYDGPIYPLRLRPPRNVGTPQNYKRTTSSLMEIMATLDYAHSYNPHRRSGPVLETLSTYTPRSINTKLARVRWQWMRFLQPWWGSGVLFISVSWSGRGVGVAVHSNVSVSPINWRNTLFRTSPFTVNGPLSPHLVNES